MHTYNSEGIEPLRIDVTQGDLLNVEFVNNLSESSTVHWHGVRVSNTQDGVAGINQDPVLPGQSHAYSFVANDPGMFFFHPHANEAEQI